MALRPFHHHHQPQQQQHRPRYAPLHHRPPLPPPRPSLSGDPNFFAPHLPPPPPPPDMHLQRLPPPPMQPSYRSSLPLLPPLYDSHQSQITFANPNPSCPIDGRPGSLQHQTMGHNHNRPVYDDDRRPMSEFENRRQGNRIPVFDFDVSSVSPYRSIEVDRFRHRSDSGFRYREDYNDGFDQNQRDEPLLVRGDAMGDDYHGRSFSYRNGSPRGYRFNNSTQRDYVDHSRICEFESGSGLGDEFLRHRRGEVYNNEDQRRGHYSNRGSTGEYKRIPRKKQSQKMSARLWPHKPNTRNKNEHSAALFDGPQPTSFRGKGPPSQLDQELLEKRERSLEELDVSFRSNVLVAKAIATPSSIVVSDRNVKSSIRNHKKVIVPSRNSSSSPISITKLNEFPVKPDGLTHASSGQFTPNSKVEYSGTRTMLITNSQPCPSGTNKQTLKSIVERPEKCVDLDKKATNVGCDGSSFVKIRRKVKDAGSLSGQTDSEGKRKPDESFDADSSLHGPFAGSRYVEGLTDSKRKSTAAGTVAKSEITVDSCFPRAVAVKGSSGVDSSRPSVRKVKQKRSSSTRVLTSSISEKTRNNECYADADLSVHNLYTTTSSDKSLTCTKDTHTPSDVEALKARKLSCKDDMIMQPENSSMKGFSDPSAKDSVCAPLLDSEEHGIRGGTVNTCSPDHEINTTISCGKILTKTQQNSSVSGFATVDALGKQSCSNQICRSVGKDTLEKNQKPVSSGEPTTFCGLLNTNCSDRSPMAASGVDNGLSCFADALTVCDTAKESDVGMQLCPGGVTESSEYCTAQAFTNAGVSVGKNIHATSGKQHAPKTKRKKVRTLPSSLPSLSKWGTTPRPKNVTNPLLGVDGTLCNTIGNLLQVESTAPDKRSLDFGRTARIITKLENGSIEGSEDVTLLNGTSSDIIKKRENLLSHQDQDVPGSLVPDITMGAQNTDALSSSIAVPSNFGEAAMAQAKEGVAVHSTDMICATGLLPSQEGSDSCLLEEPLEAMCFARYGSHKVFSKLECPSTDLCAVQESVIQNMQLPCPSGLLGEQKENAMPVTVTTSGYWDDITNMENEKHNAVLHGNCAQDRNGILSKLQCSELSQSRLNTDVDRESLVCEKLDVPTAPLCTNHDGASCADHDDDPLDSASNELHDTGSPKTLSSHTDLQMFNGRKLDEKPIFLGYSKFSTHNVSSQNLQVISSSLDAMKSDDIIPCESTRVQSKNQKKTEEITNILNGVSHGQSNQLSNAVPTFFPSRPPFTSSKKLISSSNVARSRTWRRTDNPIMPPPPEKLISGKFPLPRQLLDKIGKRPSTTYVRKGNSLVRKSPSAASFPHDSIALSTSTVMKSIVSESTVNTKDSANSLTGELSISSSRPKTPPSQLSAGLSNCIFMPSRDNISYQPEIPLSDICVRNTSHPSKPTETKDAPKSSEGNNEISSVVNDGNGMSSQNNLIYVKRKSNQLVAASNPLDLSTQNVDKTTPAFFYDGYYKRKKNQLIRTSLENQVGPTAAPSCVSLNCERQRELKVSPCRSRNRRRSDKFSAKKYKSSKFSLVWTLGSTQSVKKDRYSAQCKVLPKLFPWKRSMHWRRSMHKSAPNYSSLSPIGKKLLLLRKRDTVYTRSSNGLSLRKSKVLSIGGSSLKWSKSIESRSKKANEEATLAVAEVEREKRQQSNADCVASSSRNLPRKSVDNLGLRPGERIFRIGLVRYKMDPSRCTLQRIADDESSCFMPIQTNNNLKKCYVPKRLLIGNDEYVRIGNGNQLIRDPKKRSRILASEKVRWSLHTARLRLAKNRKYCQFYTRFGKCNKDSGKCPYMHDPSKIAVCTKFLNGLCSNLNCKLTHKVIPERMPDCSYFLLGLCSNDKCPYRHVNVNPKASICEGFLKGYCADGDECRRKHSCVCPDYEANGVCYLGSKCKLHHPKRRKEGNKRKRSEDKSGWGRYFGSIHPDNAEAPPLTVSERHGRCDIEDIFFKDGRYSDYISLDVSSDEEGGETCIPLNEQITEFEEHTSDSALDDLDNLIKPIRIMI